ncbi:flagellar FlbD family protein [Paludibaculum fermentans]|uniref:Flagellar FlbD family protein n=1 Tax=Paludibaculum fermentans TaxID=1473598 RepID=A0A7S7NKN6_PALFE|nr:flagellar FlbD family protein [Paludibaculum fermentans]QOY85397.1 flagellar FlbD family protein [Paludibaculum fermentans]
MVRLTRINQAPFYLNSDLIEFIDTTPDTLITTVSGTKILVVEGPEEVVRRVVEFRRLIHPVARGPVGVPDPAQEMGRV